MLAYFFSKEHVLTELSMLLGSEGCKQKEVKTTQLRNKDNVKIVPVLN
jgi:hypothetical protein